MFKSKRDDGQIIPCTSLIDRIKRWVTRSNDTSEERCATVSVRTKQWLSANIHSDIRAHVDGCIVRVTDLEFHAGNDCPGRTVTCSTQ